MAASTPDNPPAPRRPSRRRLFFLFACFLALAGGWQVAERLIDVERYRPVIDQGLEGLIRMPLEFGAMDLKLFPTPRLAVEQVRAGWEGFSVESPEVTVTASLAGLLKGQLNLRTVTVNEARLTMPGENRALFARWREYLATLGQRGEPGAGGGRMIVTLDTIEAPDLVITRDRAEPVHGSLQVLRVTGGAPEFVFDLHGDTHPLRAAARGALVLDMQADPRLKGGAQLENVALAGLAGDPNLPPLLLDADTTVALSPENELTVRSIGKVRLAEQPDALGPFEVTLIRDAEALRLEGLRMHTAPLSLDGAIEIADSGHWTMALEEATLRSQGIQWLVKRVPAIPVVAETGAPARGELKNIRFGGTPEKRFRFASGEIAVHDVGLNIGGTYQMAGITGTITIAEDVYTLTDFTNGHAEAAGTMTVDYGTDTVALALAGRLNLGPEFPLPEALEGKFRAEGGVVALPEFNATFVAGRVQLPRVVVKAALTDGAISVLDRRNQSFVTVKEIAGEAAFEEGRLDIAKLGGPHTRISGTITPDENLERFQVAAALQSDLSSPLWKFIEPAPISLARGKLEAKKFELDWVRGSEKPESWSVEGSITEGDLLVHTGGASQPVRISTATFTASEKSINFDGQGSSTMTGPLTARGTYGPATGALESEVRVRLAEASGLPEPWRGGAGATILQALGEVPLQVKREKTGVPLMLASGPPLHLEGKLGLNQGATPPLSLELAATMPATWLAPHLAPSVPPEGDIRLSAAIAQKGGATTIRADCSGAALGWGILRKKTGFPLVLTLQGAWDASGPALKRGQVEAGGEVVHFTRSPGAFRAEQFSVALAPLAPLLPEGGALSGRVGGSYSGVDGSIALNFDQVRGQFAAELPEIALSGALLRSGGEWRASDFAWALGESRGTFSGGNTGGTWSGRIDAEHIHGTELRDANRRWTELRGLPEDPNRLPWNFSGAFEVTTASLRWAEARMGQTTCTARFSPGAMRTEELTIAHGAGQISGGIGYASAREGHPARLTTDLTVQEVDAVLLEGLFLEKARGLAGPMNGRVNLTVPFIAEQPSVMHGISGEIEFNAKNGTLGRAGLASKLLAALRTTDILRLRLPDLKDSGLSFKTLEGQVSITDGVFRVAPFRLSESAYVLELKATFDYPKDVAEGGGEVQVLEGVTGITRKIPILGDAANLVSKVFGVPLKVSGTAKDPTFGVGVPTPVKKQE